MRFLQGFELQEHPAQVDLDHLLRGQEFGGGLSDEATPGLGGVEVEGVQVEVLAPGGEQVHLEQIEARVPLQPPHPVAAVSEGKGDLARPLLHSEGSLVGSGGRDGDGRRFGNRQHHARHPVDPLGPAKECAKRLGPARELEEAVVRIEPRGEGDREHFHPRGGELCGDGFRRSLAVWRAGEGEDHPGEGRERGLQLVGVAREPEGGGDPPMARAPPRERINQPAREYGFAFRGDRFPVPHAPQLARQHQVLGSPRPQVVVHLAPIGLQDPSGGIEHGHHEGTVQVLVAATSVEADAFELGTDRRSVLELLHREGEAQGAIGEPEPEGVDGVGMVDPPSLQKVEALGVALERVVVVVNALAKHGGIVGIEGERANRGGLLGHRGTPAGKSARASRTPREASIRSQRGQRVPASIRRMDCI